MKPFDTDKMPWLFTPHGDGELNEYFSTDHSKIRDFKGSACKPFREP